MCSGLPGPASRVPRARPGASPRSQSCQRARRESRRHGAMPRQAQADRGITVLGVDPRHVTQRVRRIGQSVQQHHGAQRLPCRQQRVRAVPVVREARRIERAAFEVAVRRHAFARSRSPRACGRRLRAIFRLRAPARPASPPCRVRRRPVRAVPRCARARGPAAARSAVTRSASTPASDRCQHRGDAPDPVAEPSLFSCR